MSVCVTLRSYFLKKVLKTDLIPIKEFLNNLRLHLRAKYKIVGLILGSYLDLAWALDILNTALTGTGQTYLRAVFGNKS